MKELLAIIRPEKLSQTESGLVRSGALGFTYASVEGRGRQKGQKMLGQTEGEIRTVHAEGFIPKVLLFVVVEDKDLKKVMDTIINVNFTNRAGDGKIFICPVEESVRIRTGEKGVVAIQ